GGISILYVAASAQVVFLQYHASDGAGLWSDNLQTILERTVTIELPRIVISCGCMSRSRVDPRRLLPRQSVHGMVLAAALITLQPALLADESPDEMIVASHPTQPVDQRILGVIPNYQT